MGKLLIGHYGQEPDVESIEITLKECHQRLGMKPSDFVSEVPPAFFRKAHGALGKYMVFQLEKNEIPDAFWRAGYYLLPMEAADVLKAFGKLSLHSQAAQVRPTKIEAKEPVPEAILKRVQSWSIESQPLLFNCHCPELVIKVDPPALFRKTWKVRLTCPKRCQPALRTQF
jgi:hypothetical protein